MRTFLISALVAVASAQEEYPVYEEETSILDSLPIEINENGNYELTWKVPQIEVSQWSEEDVRAWAEGVMTDRENLQGEWADAWFSYEDAIAQPWNDLITQVEDLYVKGAQMDIQTDEDVIKFVSENISVNGEKLNERFPQIEEYLNKVRQEGESLEEIFSLDALRVTPVTLQYNDDYYNDYYNDDYYYEDDTSARKEKLAEIAQMITDQAFEYGFDPQVVEEWFQKNGQSWQELTERHQQEAAAAAKVNVQEASQYIRGVIDNAVADMKNKVEEGQADLSQMIDERAAEYKTEIERQTNSTITSIEDFISGSFAELDDFTDDMIVLGSKNVESESSNFSYGFIGCAVLGAIATGIFLQKKKQDKTVVSATEETFLDNDEQFVQV